MARGAGHLHGFKKIAAGMVLFELGQNRIVNGFDRAGNEEAAGVMQRGEEIAMFEQMPFSILIVAS